MGIKEAHKRIKEEKSFYEIDMWDYDAKNVANGLEFALSIIEEECPEVLEKEK